jgi:ABC-2 type transport system permease protein
MPMGRTATAANALRVLTGLRRDPRTVALLIGVPTLLMVLFRYVFDGRPASFNQIGIPLLGLFPLVSMFVVASVTMLRERTGGTLERLMTMPLGKLDLLFGYGIAFGAMAVVQVAVVCVVAFGLLGLQTGAPQWQVGVLAVLNSLVGMSLGLFVSAFATTEFQAVQFMPAFVLPQFLLCGLIAPRDQMAGVLHALSDVLPMTYAYDGLFQLRGPGGWTGTVTRDVAITSAVTVIGLCLGALTLRRRTE